MTRHARIVRCTHGVQPSVVKPTLQTDLPTVTPHHGGAARLSIKSKVTGSEPRHKTGATFTALNA